MAVVWCVGLLAALYIPLAAAGVGTFVAFALASGNPKAFVDAETKQFRETALHLQKNDTPPGNPPVMPDGVSYSLAAGILAGHLGTLTYTLLLLRYVVGRDWPRQVALRRPPAVPLVLSLLALPGLVVVHSSVHVTLNELARLIGGGESGPMDSELRAMMSPWPVWFAVLLIGVGPGVIEELFCRGFLGRGLVGRYGVVGGVLLTSMLFGMLHLSPLYAVGTMVMGALLHLTYLFTRSLWVPMLLHFLNNSLSVVALLVLDSDPTDMPAVGYLLGFALAGFGLWALWSCRARLDPADLEPDPDEPEPWRQRFPGVELPPARSGAAVRNPWPNPVAVVLTLAAFVGVLYYMV
jgi:membrane protease YdiL (CAAX protease family)